MPGQRLAECFPFLPQQEGPWAVGGPLGGPSPRHPLPRNLASAVQDAPDRVLRTDRGFRCPTLASAREVKADVRARPDQLKAAPLDCDISPSPDAVECGGPPVAVTGIIAAARPRVRLAEPTEVLVLKLSPHLKVAADTDCLGRYLRGRRDVGREPPQSNLIRSRARSAS